MSEPFCNSPYVGIRMLFVNREENSLKKDICKISDFSQRFSQSSLLFWIWLWVKPKTILQGYILRRSWVACKFQCTLEPGMYWGDSVHSGLMDTKRKTKVKSNNSKNSNEVYTIWLQILKSSNHTSVWELSSYLYNTLLELR